MFDANGDGYLSVEELVGAAAVSGDRTLKVAVNGTAKAWERVLAAWNITPDPAAIRRVLQPYAGTRSPPAPHAATIENAAEVGAALRKVGLSHHFRG